MKRFLIATALLATVPLYAYAGAPVGDRLSPNEIHAMQTRRFALEVLPVVASMWLVMFDSDIHTQRQRELPPTLLNGEPLFVSAKPVRVIPFAQWCAQNVRGDRGPCKPAMAFILGREPLQFTAARVLALH